MGVEMLRTRSVGRLGHRVAGMGRLADRRAGKRRTAGSGQAAPKKPAPADPLAKP